MWAVLLKQFWPVVPTLMLCWLLHKGDVAIRDAAWQNELLQKAVQVQLVCDKDKQTTEKIDENYQQKLSSLNAKLYTAEHVRPRSCIVPQPSALAASRFNAAQATSRRPAIAHGVTSEALLAFGRDSEQTGEQLDGLQEFVCRVWKDNGQPVPLSCQ